MTRRLKCHREQYAAYRTQVAAEVFEQQLATVGGAPYQRAKSAQRRARAALVRAMAGRCAVARGMVLQAQGKLAAARRFLRQPPAWLPGRRGERYDRIW